ncbi:MAG TPA: lactonase family protein [Trebonia sp.]|nr:lactonase family protein [Trebonia sp.]
MSAAGLMYVGTFPRAYPSDTGDTAFGVYRLRTDAASGQLTPAGLTPAVRPGWIAPHPTGRFLYAAHEVHEFGGRPGGGVSAFAVDPATGELTELNSRPTDARLPCHCAVDRSGRYLLVATNLDASVQLFPIEADGRLGPVADVHRHHGSSVNQKRQSHARAHSVTLDPDGRFVLVADLGTDRVEVYELDTGRGRLLPRPGSGARVRPGSGPRHLAFRPDGRFAYLISEMSATMTAFGYDAATGALTEIQTVPTLPADSPGYHSAAEIAVHPSGRFLYATNRSYGSAEPPVKGEDSIAWFSVEQDSGRLTPCGRVHTGGEIPRSFVIDPGGTVLWVANQRSSSIAAFLIDTGTGALTLTGQPVPTPVPVCLQLLPAG